MLIEIESDWRETGIGCIHCGEMTYSDGGPRQCVDPSCAFFALPQPELVADPEQVTPPSVNPLDGDKYTVDAQADNDASQPPLNLPARQSPP